MSNATHTPFRLRGALLSTLALAVMLALAVPALAAKVTFRYQPVIGGVTGVTVAGSFNGWNTTANPMTDADKDGVWEAAVEIPAGRAEYKFVVNGDQWFTDEDAAEFSLDGNKNAVVVVADKPLVVGHGAPKKPAATGLRKVTFSYKPAAKPDKVSLAGSFNDWTVGKTPMTDADGDGVYTATLLLSPGSYTYKFVVGDNGWMQDKDGQDSDVDDGFGGKNSVKNVDDRFTAVKVAVGDGDIFPDGVEHTQGANEVNHLGGGHVEFTTRAHIGDVEGVDLETWPSGKLTTTPMREINRDKVFAYYRAEATLPSGATPYAFKYRDGKATKFLTSQGLVASDEQGRFEFEAAKFPAFETPAWVKDAVIYQIFPDRFRNGSTANDQDFKEWYYQGKASKPEGKLNTDNQEYYHLVKNWNDYQALTQCPWTPDGRDWMAFYGGDMAGVRQSLDYLQDLGVSAIYFNPIFEAKSTHKYDGADYRKVDPHFGTNEEFVALVKEAHARGIRVILDIVYNHSGNAHWAFKDAVEKGTNSSTYAWYEFKKWPLPAGWPNVAGPWKPADYYYCWWGYGDLPDLNFDLSRNNDAEKAVRDVKDAQPNIALVNHLLEATEYWLTVADADGVRLDVPNEVPYWFWKLFNARVKKAKPDAYIVGELWGNASDYVRPGVYDAVMNYAFFRDPVTKFIGMGQGNAAEFDATLAAGRLTYPRQAVECQMNLIDSHDTVRFLTQVNGDSKRLLLAALFGMTYVGAPHIYYGDEIGMEGGKDPDCRRPFVWDWEKDANRKAIHDRYKQLIALRKAHPALRTGDFRTVHADGMQYAYARSGGGEDFLVVLNAAKTDADVAVDVSSWGKTVAAKDALDGTTATWTGKATIQVPAESGRVFQIGKDGTLGKK